MLSLKNCLEEEAKAIKQASLNIELKEVEKALDLLSECHKNKQKVITSGIGKSGIVARKIAATFSSIGLMSIYLNPLDALHGDLGIVDTKDVCLLLSNSGESEELLEIIPHLKNRGAKCIALVGNIKSSIAKKCDVILDASVDKEICPLNLAPTASTAVSMAIGDGLATVWMERMEITTTDFAINHPAGQLGKKLTMKVSDIMMNIKDINPVSPDSKIDDIISAITRGGIGSVWIENALENGKITGIITDGDLRRALKNNIKNSWPSLKASDFMTTNPITIKESALAIEALKLMELNNKKPISVLPVINNSGKMAGLLRLHDLIQAGIK